MANNDKFNDQLHTGLACLPNWLERCTGITEVGVRTGKPEFPRLSLATAQIASLSVHRAPVVQKVDSAIHRINHHPVVAQLVFVILIQRVGIYPVDSAIQLLHNRWL